MSKPAQEEVRYDVMISARMRASGSTFAVCVRNVSASGLLVQCEVPPPRGSQVQIIAPRLIVTGQVVWADGHRFGFSANNRINTEIVLRASKSPPAIGHPAAPGTPLRRRAETDRSRFADAQERHEQSRRLAQLLEQATIAVVGIAAAIAIGGYVHHELSRMATEASAGLQRAP